MEIQTKQSSLHKILSRKYVKKSSNLSTFKWDGPCKELGSNKSTHMAVDVMESIGLLQI